MILARNSITLHHLRDITTVVWYYKLQASTASPPAKPTTATPSGWSTTEPTYTEGSTNSLYTVQKTTFSDGTFEYSDVSLSSSYEAAKTAYNKSVQALDAVTPIDTKTYTGLIGSANDAANASFYFAKVHPKNYTVQWNVSLRFHVTSPEAYAQDVTIRFGGYGSNFSSFDAYTVRTSSVGMYFVNLYRATRVGIETNKKGHALGIGLMASTNPTDANYARTITVELLEAENCTVDMLDTAVKYASIDGTGSTNYYGLTEMSVSTAGQNATNNSNTSYQQHGNAVKAGANGVRSYSLIMKDTDSTWSSLFGSAYNGTATGKTVCTSGFLLGSILYSAGAPSGGNYAAGANTSTVYDGYPFDFRYSSNCATTLVSYKPVYLVGEMHDDGLFYLDETWWTQTVPTAEDGKTYVYVGEAYSSYQVWLSVENPAYQFYEGKFRKLSEVEEMKASKVADNYLSSDNTGIMVADMTDGNTYTPSTVPSGTKNTFIDEDSFQVRDGQETLASFGTTIVIGKRGTNNLRAKIESGNFQIIDNSDNVLVNIGRVPAAAGEAKKVHYEFGPRQSGTPYGNYSFVQGTDNAAVFDNQVVIGQYGRYGYRFNYSASVSSDTPTFTINVSIYVAMGFTENDINIEIPDYDYTWVLNDGIITVTIIKEGIWVSKPLVYVRIGKDIAFAVGNGTENSRSDAFEVTWDGNARMALDETATTGTDAELYSAITALGWESEVIV